VVAATGNAGNGSVNFPASAAGLDGAGRWGNMALSITSVNTGDVRSTFSNYGWGDVTMSAPGEYVYAPAPDNRVAAWSGTSMGVPMVSASLALALAQRPDVKNIQLIGKAMREKNRKIYGNNPTYIKAIGSGRLDLGLFAEAIKFLK
jgi:thermitase